MPWVLKELEALYAAWTRRAWVFPDPVGFLYDYPAVADREIAGLVAACLAYGQMRQIHASIGRALAPMGSHPSVWLPAAGRNDLRRAWRGFRHRWTDGEDLADFLWTVRALLRRHGSLAACLAGHGEARHETIREGLSGFLREWYDLAPRDRSSLMPLPDSPSACKRLHLYLRWMVREDAVDPGGWSCLGPDLLVVPLDVHMYRLGRLAGLVRRRTADGAAALELTRAFRRVRPDDPVRYDFALVRLATQCAGTDDPRCRHIVEVLRAL